MGVNSSLGGFLASVASDKPTPGGGSVAALVGAGGAALVAMVCRITMKKEGPNSGEIERILARSEKLMDSLLKKVEEDAQAFNMVIRALKMPRDTEDEKNARMVALEAAKMRAVEVPLATSEACLEVMKLSKIVVGLVGRNMISDVMVAAFCAYSGVMGASCNVKINLRTIKDEAYRREMEKRVEALVGEAKTLIGEIEEGF